MKLWTGAWNNWIAPFHACPRCGASLNWKQAESMIDTPVLTASCCGVNFGAPMQWQSGTARSGHESPKSEQKNG